MLTHIFIYAVINSPFTEWAVKQKKKHDLIITHMTKNFHHLLLRCFTFLPQLVTGIQIGDPRITALIEKYDFYISPVANPDGYEYTFKNSRVSYFNSCRQQTVPCVERLPWLDSCLLLARHVEVLSQTLALNLGWIWGKCRCWLSHVTIGFLVRSCGSLLAIGLRFRSPRWQSLAAICAVICVTLKT